ncbi:hypothetical protein Y032_0275g1045 [Ancylostoma ceylanicum]|uniref:Uncharacterized protein n=1 Tax=Ancylostoma ceylanicum TaxID=53326 RepID=A0A016S7K5_9BILA|nr:hypothetical protein Y032_0275g1045 [Ancylostoma ceylanicum]
MTPLELNQEGVTSGANAPIVVAWLHPLFPHDDTHPHTPHGLRTVFYVAISNDIDFDIYRIGRGVVGISAARVTNNRYVSNSFSSEQRRCYTPLGV